jgi:peptidoglycan/LPS O-acetylase OafA/YrhL
VRIRELDGLRGIAVLAVIDCHYLSWLPATGSHYGWLGVDLFFVLSGFLISGILLELREKEHYFKTFYARRALRIFPLYYFGIFIYLSVSIALGMPGTFRIWMQYIFYYVSLLSHPIPLYGTPQGVPLAVSLGLGVLWSLSVEEIYYTIWAPVVRFTKEKELTAILIAMIVMAPLLRWRLLSENLGMNTFYCQMDGLAYGSAVALLVRHRRLSSQVWLRADRLFDGLAVVMIPLTVGFWLALKGSPLVPAAGVTFANVSFALITYALIRNAGGNQLWVRIFRAKWLRSIGMVSYSLYLFHYPLGIVSGAILAKLHLPRGVDAVSSVLLGLALSFAVAYGLWYGMESRILRWKDRKVPSPAHAEA